MAGPRSSGGTRSNRGTAISANGNDGGLGVNVCPVEDRIPTERLAPGTVDARTGRTVRDGHEDWRTHPNNPSQVAAE